jgi:phosphatidylglycerophosphatase A
MTLTPEARTAKPGLALFIATGLGLGYLPKAPGTWGSLLGVALTLAASLSPSFLPLLIALVLVVAAAGVWAAGRVSVYLGKEDPQIVVIDEVAGQLITLLAIAGVSGPANWKYLLAGFLLFRLFDIWKPFPIRRAESLPGGLGIMADDWLAGIYAAVLLALARHLGL